MQASTRTAPARTHPRGSSFDSVLSGWAQQGVQSLFATQRILVDLAMRQNANVAHALRQQLTDPHHSPTAILNEVAGEGMTNFIVVKDRVTESKSRFVNKNPVHWLTMKPRPK